MLSGPNDHCNAFVTNPRRGRRHRGVRLGRDADADVPDVGRIQGVQGRDHRPRRRRRGRHPGGEPSTSRANTPTAISAASRASIAWSGSARSTPRRGGIPRSPRSTSCPRSTTRSTSSSRTTTSSATCSARAAPAASTRTRPSPASATPTCPTGVAAESRSERSQHKNDVNALALLKAKLIRLEEEKREAEFAKKYDEKGDVSFGNQIRSYVLQPYQLVKDARTGHEVGNPRAVLDGGLDGFIESYLRTKLSGAGTAKGWARAMSRRAPIRNSTPRSTDDRASLVVAASASSLPEVVIGGLMRSSAARDRLCELVRSQTRRPRRRGTCARRAPGLPGSAAPRTGRRADALPPADRTLVRPPFLGGGDVVAEPAAARAASCSTSTWPIAAGSPRREPGGDLSG